jgi:hypothetical protein
MNDYLEKFNVQGSKFKVQVRWVLIICLICSFLGCSALTTYPPNYQPSEWETSIGPPYWYLNESGGGCFETINPKGCH